MSKKKPKKTVVPQILSPKEYIRQKARSLPIVECLITPDWKVLGFGNALVVRKHKTGNFTLGFYLVDCTCLGVKDTFYQFNIGPNEYDEIKEHFDLYGHVGLQEIPYNELHNLIYGAVAYAEDLGIDPHPDFALTRYILEEDDDRIPMTEYEFGKNGMPLLVVHSQLEASKYLPILNKSVGEGNYHYIIRADEEDMDEDDGDFNHNNRLWNFPTTEYTYQHPEYPQELTYKNKVLDALFNPEYVQSLPEEIIGKILELPHDELVDDLKNCILYETGRTWPLLSGPGLDEEFIPVLFHALFFLGELKDESTLDVVLEVMRQDDEFYDYHFADSAYEVLPLTLYYVGRNRLDKLFAYVQEPGLEPMFRMFVFEAVTCIAVNEPARRGEVIEWYRRALVFYIGNVDDTTVFDAELAADLICSLMDIRAAELLPEIYDLLDTGCIDESICGDSEKVEEEINSESNTNYPYTPMDIYERYREYKKAWGDNE